MRRFAALAEAYRLPGMPPPPPPPAITVVPLPPPLEAMPLQPQPDPVLDHDAGEAEAMAWFYAQPAEDDGEGAVVVEPISSTPPLDEKTQQTLVNLPISSVALAVQDGAWPSLAEPGVFRAVRTTSPEEVAAFYLERDAEKVRRILDAGGTAEWCPRGGLDLHCRSGRFLLLSPTSARRLLEAGALPLEVVGRAPPGCGDALPSLMV